jgi:hypothetical protein
MALINFFEPITHGQDSRAAGGNQALIACEGRLQGS